jgi:hypothetical protein
MTLAELRELRPKWTIEHTSAGIRCQYGAFRVLAADPDDAEDEIETRVGPPDTPRPPRAAPETNVRDTALSGIPEPGTFGAFLGDLAKPGF